MRTLCLVRSSSLVLTFDALTQALYLRRNGQLTKDPPSFFLLLPFNLRLAVSSLPRVVFSLATACWPYALRSAFLIFWRQ